MASYLINKRHQDESVVSIKELEGYQFKPRSTKDSYIKVDRVTIVDRVMIDKILTMKFNKSFKKVVALAMQVIEAPCRKIKRRVMNVLELVGLRNRANAYPGELSGGEQQRVAIARAIVNDPLLVIADEPTGNLDPETSWDIMEIFKEINETGTTIVMATHDKEIVDGMGKRVIAIEKGFIVRDEKNGVYGYEL